MPPASPPKRASTGGPTPLGPARWVPPPLIPDGSSARTGPSSRPANRARNGKWVFVVAGIVFGVTMIAVALGFVARSESPSASPEPPSPIGINLVYVKDSGCSPDFFTDPDPHAQVFVNGHRVLSGGENNKKAAWPATYASIRVGEPVTVRVQGYEAEPGGSEPCRTAPGGDAEFKWDGSEQVKVLADGNLEVKLVLGHPPALPAVHAEPDGDNVRLWWDEPPVAPRSIHVWNADDASSSNLGPDVRMASVKPACDNAPFHPRVVFAFQDWLVPVNVDARAPNTPPTAPIVNLAQPFRGHIDVRWTSPTTHDIARYDIHVVTPGEQSGPGNLVASRGTFHRFSTESQQVPSSATTGQVIVVAYDTEGASAASAPLDIGTTNHVALAASDPCPVHESLQQQPVPAPGLAVSGALLILLATAVTMRSRNPR